MEITRHNFDQAIRNNNLDYIILCNDIEHEHYFNNHCFDIACEYGSIDIVKWLYNNKQLTGSHIKPYDFACMNGHLEIVKFLDDNNINEHSINALKLAMKNNHRDIIEYLYKQNSMYIRYEISKYADNEIIYYIKNKNYKMIDFLYRRLDKNKFIDIKYLLETKDNKFITDILNNYDINFKIYDYKILKDCHINIIELLYEKNILVLNNKTMKSLIYNNLYDIIVYFVDSNYFKITEEYIDYALENYRLDIAKYLYKNNNLNDNKIWRNAEQEIVEYKEMDDWYIEYKKYKSKHGVIISWLRNYNIDDDIINKIIKDYHNTYKRVDKLDNNFDY